MLYKTHGTCSVAIEYEIKDNVIQSVHFIGGCPGNTEGLSRLLPGMNVDDVIAKLDGVNCGGKGTSCPDQLARALKQYKAKAAAS